MRLIITKPKQIKAWIDQNKLQWEFWERVVREETYGMLNKTKEEAINLSGYYEGRYDLACNIRSITAELVEN